MENYMGVCTSWTIHIASTPGGEFWYGDKSKHRAAWSKNGIAIDSSARMPLKLNAGEEREISGTKWSMNNRSCLFVFSQYRERRAPLWRRIKVGRDSIWTCLSHISRNVDREQQGVWGAGFSTGIVLGCGYVSEDSSSTSLLFLFCFVSPSSHHQLPFFFIMATTLLQMPTRLQLLRSRLLRPLQIPSRPRTHRLLRMMNSNEKAFVDTAEIPRDSGED